MNGKQEEEAVFWCSLPAPRLLSRPRKGELCQRLRERSGNVVVFPDGSKQKPKIKTMRRKLKRHGRSGLAALARMGRGDRGKPVSKRRDLHPWAQAAASGADEIDTPIPTAHSAFFDEKGAISTGRRCPTSCHRRPLRKETAKKGGGA
jgi:hypothetical protein